MECSLPTTDIWQKERNFKNTNSLMNPTSRYYYKYCTGLKTGYTTPARNCLISTSNKNGFELISVILHAETTEDGLSARYLDTINLFNYGYKNFKIEDIYEEYNLIGHIDNSDKNDFSKENINYKEMKKNSFINKYTLLLFFGIVILNKINKKYKRNTKSRHSYSNSYSKMYSFKYDL